jgi:membrane glycosyltransferase
MPMTAFELVATVALGAVGGVVLSRYCAWFGFPFAWAVGPIIAGILYGSVMLVSGISAEGYPFIAAFLVGVLISVPIARWRLGPGGPDRL